MAAPLYPKAPLQPKGSDKGRYEDGNMSDEKYSFCRKIT
jgi:hypothetical protein